MPDNSTVASDRTKPLMGPINEVTKRKPARKPAKRKPAARRTTKRKAPVRRTAKKRK